MSRPLTMTRGMEHTWRSLAVASCLAGCGVYKEAPPTAALNIPQAVLMPVPAPKPLLTLAPAPEPAAAAPPPPTPSLPVAPAPAPVLMPGPAPSPAPDPAPAPAPTPAPAPAPPPAPPPGPVPAPPGAPYTFIGRFDHTDALAPRFALLGSRIGATFTGTSISVTLEDGGTNLYNVTLDGGPPQVLATRANAGPVVYPLAVGLSGAQHTVWLSKRTEFMQSGDGRSVGLAQFHGFTLDANGIFLVPPAPQSRRIEFDGDSGFTGYGADSIITGGSSYCSYTPESQNADASIPAYTAGYLQADAINLSSSGQAVYISVYDNNSAHNLPTMYSETLPPAAAPAWDFSKWTADVVVFSAGGDDVSGNSGSGTFIDRNAFVKAYVNWLVQVRQNYPHALVVLVLSQSAKQADVALLGDALREVVADRNQAGDPQVVYYSYFDGDPTYHTYDDAAIGLKLYWGCGYHPSAKGAAFLGQRLATFIAGKMGW